MQIVSSLVEIISMLLPAFTEPGAIRFQQILLAWILCPGRRTITGMIPFADPEGKSHYSSFHRFIRAGAWSCNKLFRLWTKTLVAALAPSEVLWLQTDDTVHKKSGRKIDGAATWRDAVRSTKSKIAYAWGLQFVALCLRVNPPWGGEPLALPINVRLHRKGGDKLPALVASPTVGLIVRGIRRRRGHLFRTRWRRCV